jgi:K+-transporting ATPase c subunit
MRQRRSSPELTIEIREGIAVIEAHCTVPHKEMTLQTIPAAANTIKAILSADQAASSQQIDDIISRYLRVRDSSAIEQIENELAAIFASGVDQAASVVADLESLPRILRDTRVSPQQGARVVGDSGSRLRAAIRNNRPSRFADRIGPSVKT